MKIGNIELGERPIFLAPMEDVTDIGFRMLCKRFGASMVYTEFVSAEALVRDVKSTVRKLTIADEERPVGIQIYGRDVEAMVEAAKMVEQAGPDLIDLNFGCPVKKVAGKGAGAGMLQNIPKMLEITEKVVQAVKLPVTVKTRLGWNHEQLIITTLAEQLQDCGIQALTIHGRTRSQMYTGNADWTLIGEVKRNPRIHIPIIGNGDIKSLDDADQHFDQYGVDAVMIGRATFGQPWIFSRRKLTLDEKIDVLEEQLRINIERCETGTVPTVSSEANYRGTVPHVQLPKVHLQGFSDIHVVPGDELIETLASSYSKVGLDETMVVTRSNKRANIFNQGIRNQILGREEELTTGDQLMVVKNNYFWTKPESPDAEGSSLEFIANGDMAVVRKVRNVHEQYGFRFAEVTMTFPDYDDYELTATVLLDTLTSEAPALTRDQQEALYNKVLEDYADIPRKHDRMKALKEDRYYNALQVKYAYAATCHKAQGGQWAHIYVDQGYMTDDMLSADYLHWLYTAFTRATEQLYLINWPKTQIERCASEE